MQTDQKAEFQKRRMAVLKHHIANDPKLRAERRKRKLSILFSVAGSLVVTAVVLLLLKSFLLAHHGPRGYAQIMAPVLQGLDRESIAGQIFGADPVSTEIAAILRPILPAASAPFASTAIPSGDAVDSSAEPEQAPEI